MQKEGDEELQHGHRPMPMENVVSLGRFNMGNGVMQPFQLGVLGPQSRGRAGPFGFELRVRSRPSLPLEIGPTAMGLLLLHAHVVDGDIDGPWKIFVDRFQSGGRNLAIRRLARIIIHPGLAYGLAR